MTKLSIAYLHVGADKTGSTTIQKFFHANRHILKNHGYYYPSVIEESWNDIASTYSHHLVATHFSHNLTELDYYSARKAMYTEIEEKNKARRYVEFITEEVSAGSYDALILSYEGFNVLKPNELNALRNYLLSMAEEVKVIYYLRPRFSYGLSALSQRVSLGEPAWKYHPPINYYRQRLLAFESIFGKENLFLRRFSKEDFLDGDFFSDFCYAVGLGHTFIEESYPVQPSNESLSELAIRVGDALVFLLNEVDGPKGIDFHKLFITDLKLLGGRPYSFNELQNNIIDIATKEDSLFVYHNYGIDLNDTATLSDDKCPTITNESAESVARYLIHSKLPTLSLTDAKYAPVDGVCIRSAQGCLSFLGYKLCKFGFQQQLKVTVRIKNSSCSFWGGDLVPVNLSYRWFTNKGKGEVNIDSIRTHLPGGGIAAGEIKEMVMSVLLPESDGDYILKLSLVQEFCAWLEDIGFNAQIMAVKIAGGEVVSVFPKN